ncbi:hypothetical protein BIY23_03905 [Wolbachia pipientis]|uniref:Uncharacterized protein n=1 Tax=Wolbachia pipientis TaxID=955 RepID=A0A1E7QJN6_WOLPI|nr:hypothetical protein [Wolbachia pipientis]OEY86434.1 hypothetical protein BIY23_03905 [Wolbachia pipientis]
MLKHVKSMKGKEKYIALAAAAAAAAAFTLYVAYVMLKTALYVVSISVVLAIVLSWAVLAGAVCAEALSKGFAVLCHLSGYGSYKEDYITRIMSVVAIELMLICTCGIQGFLAQVFFIGAIATLSHDNAVGKYINEAADGIIKGILDIAEAVCGTSECIVDNAKVIDRSRYITKPTIFVLDSVQQLSNKGQRLFERIEMKCLDIKTKCLEFELSQLNVECEFNNSQFIGGR